MPVECFIRTGERSILSYFSKSLSDQLHWASKHDCRIGWRQMYHADRDLKVQEFSTTPVSLNKLPCIPEQFFVGYLQVA